jgi:hypothetical protein
MVFDGSADIGPVSGVGESHEALHGERLVTESTMESPIKATWNPGAPKFLTRCLIALSGVDPLLAVTMPIDEQQGMVRVGLAVIFGVAFQAICFGVALTGAFGLRLWTMPVTFVLCAIMYAYDSKFVAADWMYQGLVFCRSRGIIPKGGWLERVKRPSAILVRWTMSLFIASTLAIFVLLVLFDKDIEHQLAIANQTRNESVKAEITSRYEVLVADLTQNMRSSDIRLKDLKSRYEQARESNAMSVDIDRQISDILNNINWLEKRRESAERMASEHRRDVQAEKYGVRLNKRTTGIAGRGRYYEFYGDLATDQEASARALASEIENANRTINELRAQRSGILNESNKQSRMRLEAIENQIAMETTERAHMTLDFRRLHDQREQWVETQIRKSPNYVSMSDGILSKLQGLGALMTGNNLMASLALSTKLLIMLLESAGPVAKVFFTSTGLYQMSIALRFQDEAEMEIDRRLKWEHWRMIMRDRIHTAIHERRAARRLREASSRAQEAFDRIVDRL